MAIIADVKELVDDAGVFYIDAHIYDAVNEATLRHWALLKHNQVSDDIVVTAGQEYVSIPASIMIPRRIVSLGIERFPVSLGDLERYDKEWRNATPSHPQYFAIWDAETFRIWPKSDATYLYKVEGQGYPSTEVSVSVSDISTNHNLKKAIVFSAGASLVANHRQDLHMSWKSQAEEYNILATEEIQRQFKDKIFAMSPANRAAKDQLGDIASSRLPVRYI